MFTKIASNTISQIFSKAATAIISIFLISMLTNYLTVELYGLYSKVYNYIGIFVFLADLGLYAITIREITNDKDNSSKIVGNVMSLRLILGILILFFATAIAYFLPGYNSNLALISIAIASVFTIFQLLNSSILALMQANMQIEFSAVSLITSKLVNLGVIGAIAYIFYPKEFIQNSDYFTPFLYIIFSGVIAVVINTIMNLWYARKIVKFGFDFDWEYIKHLFKISLPYGLALFLSVVYFKVDVIILSLMEGPEKGDLSIALYSLPMKIVEVLMVIGGFYMTSLLPSLTKAFKGIRRENDLLNNPPTLPSSEEQDLAEIDLSSKKDLDLLISTSFKVLFSFSILVFTLGVLFRDYLIEIIANRNYIETTHIYNSSDAFLIVFAVIVFNFLSLVFIYSLVASENQSKLLKINIIVTLFNIIGNIIMIPKYSFIGAGMITLFSQIMLTGMGYYYTRKLIKFNLPIGFIIKNLLLGAFIFILGYFVLNTYNVGLYFDFIVYGGVLFSIYAGILFREFKKKKI
ncbi:MAG: oligosaccharide flippase family protein [Candidatus Gracilibacteria bacterium]|nr:oligosaccharide flippase family protein [Candidatus Gracilibacteria bacterium]